MRKMFQRGLTSPEREYIEAHFRVDMSATQIAKQIGHGCTRNQVLGHGQRHSLQPKCSQGHVEASEAQVKSARVPYTVPLVMANLAQFDPVVARACEMRRQGIGLRPTRII